MTDQQLLDWLRWLEERKRRRGRWDEHKDVLDFEWNLKIHGRRSIVAWPVLADERD